MTTNREKLKEMSDEELAKWLWLKAGNCPPVDECPAKCGPCAAEDCWVAWLRKDVGWQDTT